MVRSPGHDLLSARRAFRSLPPRNLILGLVALVPALTACNLSIMPSAAHPSCSWEKQVPGNGDEVCVEVARTLNRLVTAEINDDSRTIHRLVPNRRVASRVAAYGATVRRQHVRSFHMLPSPTLDIPATGVIGASIELRGRTPIGGLFSGTETVYMRIRGGTAYVFDDQKLEDW